MRTFLVITLAFAAWLTPIKAASALLTDTKTEEIVQVNYGPYEQPAKPGSSNPEKLGRDASGIRRSNPETSTSYSGRNYSKEEVQDLIRTYSAQYGIDSRTPLCIARAESGFNQFSKNKSSSASGVFQYLSSTWRGTDEGKAGLSVFDADANVRAAVKYMGIHKRTSPWVVAPSCPPLRFL